MDVFRFIILTEVSNKELQSVSMNSGLTSEFKFSLARFVYMDGTCPACRQSGIVSPLYSFSSVSGAFSNLCSNSSCSYPFESYDALLSSLQQSSEFDPTLPSSELHYAPDSSLELNLDILEPPESVPTQNSRTPEQSTPCVNNVNIGSPVLQQQFQKPCAILPRYLADSIREANSTPRGFSHSPDSDSGVSTTSATSNLSYKEVLALRAQRSKAVNETPRPVRPVSLLEQYSRKSAT